MITGVTSVLGSEETLSTSRRPVSGGSTAAILDLFLESLPAFVWATDTDLRLTFLDGNVLDQMGIGDREIPRLIGTHGESLLGTDAPQILERFRPLQRGKAVRFELSFRGRWYSVRAEPLRDSTGKPIGSIGIGLDTTERHELAEELIRERDALAETQQLAQLGSWSHDLKSNTTTVSRELARILGIPYAKEPIPFSDIERRLHPDDRQRVLCELAQAVRLREAFRIDHRILQGAGSLRYVRTQGTFEFDDTGNPLRSIGSMIDTTERMEAQQAAEHLAYHDTLTGLPNRLLLADRIAQNVALAQREHEIFYVVFLDLDHFKNINDALGHAQGDLLLIEVANRLRRATRTSDTVARSGGEEFVILLPKLEYDVDLEKTIAKLRGVFSIPFHLTDGDHVVTASIGYAAYPADGFTADDLLKHADTAMYDAKRAGRNTIRRYAPKSTDTNLRRMQLEIDLTSALDDGQFLVYYQPIFDANTLTMLGVEALVRWQHPLLGLLEPAQFIPLAEHSDYIIALGRWVINDACGTVSRLREKLNLPLRLSVNVSPRQIVTIDHFLLTLEEALQSNNIEANMLDLEMTENTLLREFESAVGLVSQIRALGVGIAIDDFGTGYNSFTYLKHFPVTELKIDRSFISEDNVFDEAISSAIATLGKSLGLRVTAEGVETKEQCAFLKAIGCDRLQGYYFAAPMPPAQLIERYALK
jgi:diguanylate cyclase (GGDEF)-like protein/PAS domain S-box-containing protein